MKQSNRGALMSRTSLAHVLLAVTLLALTAWGCKKDTPTPAPTRTPGIVLVTPPIEVPTIVPQPSATPTYTAPATLAPTTQATAAPTMQATAAPPTPLPEETKPAYPGPLPEASSTPEPYPKP